MEQDSEHDENIVAEENKSSSQDADIIALLNAIFTHGSLDLPPGELPYKSVEERQSVIKSICEQIKNIKDKPMIVNWLQSGLFMNEELNIPLALLLIGWYEQHPLQKDEECNFREIYHFIYKLMKNQPVSHLSHNSAKVLYTLLSEVIDEVWPNSQNEILYYLNQAYSYSRPGLRKTYSRRK